MSITLNLIERELRYVPIDQLQQVYDLIASLSKPKKNKPIKLADHAVKNMATSSQIMAQTEPDAIVGMFTFDPNLSQDYKNILRDEATSHSGWTIKETLP